MEDEIHFELNLYELGKGNVGEPYQNEDLPGPNLCIPVQVKMRDRLLGILKNSFFSSILFAAGIILLIASYNERSLLMFLSSIPMLTIGLYLFYSFVLQYLSLQAKDELILVKDKDKLKIFKKSSPDSQNEYDMSKINGIWLSDSYTNGALSNSAICMSYISVDESTNGKTKTIYLNYHDIHLLNEVNRCVNTVIVYDFISNNFPNITIGYKE